MGYIAYRDPDAYFNALEERLERMPRCSICRNHIQTEYALNINDEFICEDCERDNAYDVLKMIRDDYLVPTEE